MVMNQVNTVKQDYEAQLMRLPNVTGVGVGERKGKTVIKVFVTQKVPESNLKPHEVVPKSIEGCETDVEEIRTVTAQI